MKTEILFPEVANLCGDLMNVTFGRSAQAVRPTCSDRW